MVGYSFGSIIAIELTRRLETMNFKGRLVLIDGAPEQMRLVYKDFVSNYNETDLQILSLAGIMEIYSGRSSETVQFFLKLILKLIYDTFIISFHTYFYLSRNQYQFICSVIFIFEIFFLKQLICKNKTINFIDSSEIEEM